MLMVSRWQWANFNSAQSLQSLQSSGRTGETHVTNHVSTGNLRAVVSAQRRWCLALKVCNGETGLCWAAREAVWTAIWRVCRELAWWKQKTALQGQRTVHAKTWSAEGVYQGLVLRAESKGISTHEGYRVPEAAEVRKKPSMLCVCIWADIGHQASPLHALTSLYLSPEPPPLIVPGFISWHLTTILFQGKGHLASPLGICSHPSCIFQWLGSVSC